jgi:hypothetical protein
MRTPVIAKKKTGASTTDPDWLKSARVGGGNRLLLAPRRKGGVVHRKLIEGQNGYKVLAYEAEKLELAFRSHRAGASATGRAQSEDGRADQFDRRRILCNLDRAPNQPPGCRDDHGRGAQRIV